MDTPVGGDYSYKAKGVPKYRTIEALGGKDLGDVSELHWMKQGGIVTKAVHAILGKVPSDEVVIPLF